MDKEELKKKLDDLNIDSKIYSLDGSINIIGIVLFKNYDVWEIINIDDRGNQKIIKKFNNENDACIYIYNEFFKFNKVINDDKLNKRTNNNNNNNKDDIIYL